MKSVVSCAWTVVTVIALAAAHAVSGADSAVTARNGWAPKFYPGLEAVGSVEWVPKAFKGKIDAVRLKWESGAMKFGVWKPVTTELSGFVDWTVSAHVKSEGNYGYAGAAMEFFDEKGKSLGVVSSKRPMVAHVWRKMEWTFSAPKAAKRYAVHLLSLNKEPVLFAKMKVTSKQGKDKGEIPFETIALPAEWNKDWNGGTVRMLNFSDAPIPVSFYFKGRMREMKAPRLEVDIPDCLEVRDACCPAGGFFERLVPSVEIIPPRPSGALPLSQGESSQNSPSNQNSSSNQNSPSNQNSSSNQNSPSKIEGVAEGRGRMIRYSFGKAEFYKRIAPDKFRVDEGLAVKLVIAPKSGCAADGKSFTIRYRTMDGERRGEEKAMEMAFRRLPDSLKTSKDFFVFSWNNVDRHFADDAVTLAAARAYEAAGLRSFRRTLVGDSSFDRKKVLEGIYAGRPVKYIFSGRFGDLWRLGPCGIGKELAKELDLRMAVSSDAYYADSAKGKMCPEYFTTNPKFLEYLRGRIRMVLQGSGVKDGDWVTFDMEPWQSSTWCHCEECHKAFAAFAGVDHVPSSKEIAEKFADQWAMFRCSHNEKSVEIVSKFIKEYNPTLQCVDYDYIMPYGDEAGMMARRRACGKDTFVNEKWLDGHLCSYYHTIDKAAFLAMRNNVRFLKKFYVPMAALCGYGSYLRPGEVLNPRQIRQFALAAFMNGCPGYAFYSGVCYDGEVLLKMMEAQDEVVRYEGLPWGKTDGKAEPKCASDQFAFASTVRPDGTEVVALFNYEGDETIRVSLAGQEHEVEPYGVKFVEVGSR